jgi:hypothetical protein
MSTFWLNCEGPPSNDTDRAGSSPSSPIRTNASPNIDSAQGRADNVMPGPERSSSAITIEGTNYFPSPVSLAVTAMPEDVSQPPVTVMPKRRGSILEYLGWRPYAAPDGGDVGVFPARS